MVLVRNPKDRLSPTSVALKSFVSEPNCQQRQVYAAIFIKGLLISIMTTLKKTICKCFLLFLLNEQINTTVSLSFVYI